MVLRRRKRIHFIPIIIIISILSIIIVISIVLSSNIIIPIIILLRFEYLVVSNILFLRGECISV